jgi:hypothetical protein
MILWVLPQELSVPMPDCCVERKSEKFKGIREWMTRIAVDKSKKISRATRRPPK